jgi:hypothetical protein
VTIRFPNESDLDVDNIELPDLIDDIYDDAEPGTWKPNGTWTHPAQIERPLRAPSADPGRDRWRRRRSAQPSKEFLEHRCARSAPASCSVEEVGLDPTSLA